MADRLKELIAEAGELKNAGTLDTEAIGRIMDEGMKILQLNKGVEEVEALYDNLRNTTYPDGGRKKRRGSRKTKRRSTKKRRSTRTRGRRSA